jgi:hypothetical protein
MGRGADKSRSSVGHHRSKETDFEPEQILQALVDHKVRFVVIGLLAAVFQGAEEATQDIDVTPDRDTQNLIKLCEALREIEAFVIDEQDRPMSNMVIDDQRLRLWETTHLQTKYGKIDIVINPIDAQGYSDLNQDSYQRALPSGERVQALILKRIISSKKAADRLKDRAAVPRLERLLRSQEEKRGS